MFEVELTADPSSDLLRYHPAISMTTPKEEVRLLQESPWRSATQGVRAGVYGVVGLGCNSEGRLLQWVTMG